MKKEFFRNVLLLFAFITGTSLYAANLLPGDTSGETEIVTLANGRTGGAIYGHLDRLVQDGTTAFEGRKSLRADHQALYCTKKGLKLVKGKTYTFSFYAKASSEKIRGGINCAPFPLIRPWPLPKGEKNITYTKNWKRYTFTFKATHNAPYVGLYNVKTRNARVWFDAFQLEEGNKATAYKSASPVNAGIRMPLVHGNIHYMDEYPYIKVAIRKNCKKAGNYAVQLSLSDRHGKVLASKKVKAHFPNGKEECEIDANFPKQGIGWYRVQAEIKGEKGKKICEARKDFVITQRAGKYDKSVLPFSSFCSMYSPTDLFLRFGNNWRNYCQGFSYSRAGKGKSAFYGLNIVKEDKKNGLKVKLMVDMHPPVRLLTAEEKAAMKKYGLSPVRFVPGKHCDEDWKIFMEDIVKEFGPYVDAWEFGGEIDARFGLNPYYKNKYPSGVKGVFITEPVTTRVAELVAMAAKIIRKHHPEAIITAVRPCDVDCRSNFIFSSSVYSKLKGHVNGFGIDSYARPRRIGDKEPQCGPVTDLIALQKEAKKVLALAGKADGKIFISEYGYELKEGAENDLRHLRTYAACYAQSNLMARAAGFDFLAFYNSIGQSISYSHYFDSEPLPSVATICNISRFLQNVNKTEYLIPMEGIVLCIFGRTDGSAAGAVFTCNSEDTPLIYLPSYAKNVRDMDGKNLAVTQKGNKKVFEVGYEPILFSFANYAEAKKALKEVKVVPANPLHTDMRMRYDNVVKMYLTNKLKSTPVRFILTLKDKKYEKIVPPAGRLLLDLPIGKGEKKLAGSFYYPESDLRVPFSWTVPPVRKVPRLAKGFAIDGNGEKWKNIPGRNFETMDLIYPVDVFGWHGKNDLSVQLKMAHDGKYLYLAAWVKDDLHCNSHKGKAIARGDHLQIAFDPLRNTAGLAKDKRRNDDTNCALALAAKKVAPLFYYGPDKELFKKGKMTVTRNEKNKITFYELALPLESLLLSPASRRVFGFASTVFDDDSGTRWDYYMNLIPGITGGYDPGKFDLFILE